MVINFQGAHKIPSSFVDRDMVDNLVLLVLLFTTTSKVD